MDFNARIRQKSLMFDSCHSHWASVIFVNKFCEKFKFLHLSPFFQIKMSQSASTLEKKLQSELDALKNTQKGKKLVNFCLETE